MPEPGWLGSSFSQLALIEVELAVGLGLLFGIRPVLFRLIAMVLFSAFFYLALSRAAAGARSCACLGAAIQAHPSVMVVTDLAILLLLCSWRPMVNQSRDRQGAGMLARRVLLSAMILFLAVLPVSLVWGRSVFADSPLPISPGVIDLGTMVQGERREFVVDLQSPSDTPIEVDAIESSCDCLEVTLPGRVVGARQKILARLKLDLSAEPTFAGKLRLEVVARNKQVGQVAFRIIAMVTVKKQ